MCKTIQVRFELGPSRIFLPTLVVSGHALRSMFVNLLSDFSTLFLQVQGECTHFVKHSKMHSPQRAMSCSARAS